MTETHSHTPLPLHQLVALVREVHDYFAEASEGATGAENRAVCSELSRSLLDLQIDSASPRGLVALKRAIGSLEQDAASEHNEAAKSALIVAKEALAELALRNYPDLAAPRIPRRLVDEAQGLVDELWFAHSSMGYGPRRTRLKALWCRAVDRLERRLNLL